DARYQLRQRARQRESVDVHDGKGAAEKPVLRTQRLFHPPRREFYLPARVGDLVLAAALDRRQPGGTPLGDGDRVARFALRQRAGLPEERESHLLPAQGGDGRREMVVEVLAPGERVVPALCILRRQAR